MAATRHEARGVAREPDGGTPRCPKWNYETSRFRCQAEKRGDLPGVIGCNRARSSHSTLVLRSRRQLRADSDVLPNTRYFLKLHEACILDNHSCHGAFANAHDRYQDRG